MTETKIKMDLTEYKSTIESHQQQMALHLNSLEGLQNHFDNKIKEAKIYPNWAVMVLIGSLVMGVGTVVYLGLNYFGKII